MKSVAGIAALLCAHISRAAAAGVLAPRADMINGGVSIADTNIKLVAATFRVPSIREPPKMPPGTPAGDTDSALAIWVGIDGLQLACAGAVWLKGGVSLGWKGGKLEERPRPWITFMSPQGMTADNGLSPPAGDLNLDVGDLVRITVTSKAADTGAVFFENFKAGADYKVGDKPLHTAFYDFKQGMNGGRLLCRAEGNVMIEQSPLNGWIGPDKPRPLAGFDPIVFTDITVDTDSGNHQRLSTAHPRDINIGSQGGLIATCQINPGAGGDVLQASLTCARQ
ncbi:hypothetical protein B0T24DRAFT_720271 [Lasiosphaeria ovina]|uniref:DUF5666 domain-containing protein n=1 Tax=Lasiosphaeria ovina TaxID=92902 RepID=A0AAE0N857_9PEZI|nr:hypothetical protein B0T24DRAFT_720271 [Lasiosphaeria ovina]